MDDILTIKTEIVTANELKINFRGDPFKEINEKYEKYVAGTLTEEDCKPTEAAKKFLDIKKQLEDLEKL
jgi:hypothetical protein